MAELVTVGDRQYLKRSPIGVMGLAFITFGVYFFIWYYKINEEIRTTPLNNRVRLRGGLS